MSWKCDKCDCIIEPYEESVSELNVGKPIVNLCKECGKDILNRVRNKKEKVVFSNKVDV